MSTKVVIIVNPNFGKRLANLPLDVAAWIIESPVNTSAVKGFCEQQPPKNHVAVPTIFRGSPESSPEDVFINEFSTIDLHHGPYSANPPYSEIEVFGVPLTPRIRAMLAEYGFEHFHPTSDGFVAKRGRMTAPDIL